MGGAGHTIMFLCRFIIHLRSALRRWRAVCAAGRGRNPVDLDALSGLLGLGKVVLI
jgi:hypothetical protein